MKSSLVLISAIAAATAALGVSSNALASGRDAQAQAAALLNPSHVSVSERAQENASSQSTAVDAQAHAAALLSGVRAEGQTEALVELTSSPTARTSRDAQAQAAALLSGSRSTVEEGTQTTAAREKLGVHPAVAVAQAWSTRGIDPNTFIVAHPARLQLIATPSSEQEPQLAQAKETQSTGVAQSRGVTGVSGE